MRDADNPTPVTEPVNRARRFKFVASVVAFCLVVSAVLVLLAGTGIITLQIPLIQVLVENLLSLGTITTVAYIGGSSIDYNGGIANMFKARKDGS